MTSRFSVPAVVLAVLLTLAYQLGAHRATSQVAPAVEVAADNAADFIPAGAEAASGPRDFQGRPDHWMEAAWGYDYSQSLLHSVQWDKRDLHEIKLTDCKIIGGSARGVNLRGASFYGEGTLMARVDFRDANLQEASAGMGSAFDGCNFSQADLQGAFLAGSSFVRCRFDGADLRSAQLQNVDLSTCNGLESANLAGATYDADTKLPTGFSPEAAGMVPAK